LAPAAPRRFVHHGAFGNDRFGILAERFARFFGTPRFIIGQTILVALWIVANGAAFTFRWDPYPFILLNLAFSTQAAYAAPLILLAQTRQADRDKTQIQMDEDRHDRQLANQAAHVEAIKAETASLRALLQSNTDLTKQDTELTEGVAALAKEIRQLLLDKGPQS
jgi:uncharacterized membrane protein